MSYEIKQFFRFDPDELLEKSGILTPAYHNDYYININNIISVTRVNGDLYKILINNHNYYIKGKTFERLKEEVLECKIDLNDF